MIHIVFNTADIAALEAAIALDESLVGKIIEIKDDYAVGPLLDIYETEGFQLRKNWWGNVLAHSPYTDQLDIVDDRLTVHQLINALNHDENESIWIWMGQNAHDVCGYYWLMSQFKEYQGRIHVLYLNNLPFLNEKGQLFYPTYLSQIQPKEFIKAKKLARPITLSEFELDPDEWNKICTEQEVIKFLEGGKKIVNMDINFYDKEILSLLTKNAQKLPSALSNILAKMKVKTGDAFVVYRLKALADLGKIVFVGDWEKGWKDMVIQMPGGSNQVIED
ncbi:MAG: DUF1835 domain-containing protein [Chitinophagaceae bacterium]|jgi:hypothetical protein|nr:DUF1835 domain-containing protein [Sediminibacterium sp.]